MDTDLVIDLERFGGNQLFQQLVVLVLWHSDGLVLVVEAKELLTNLGFHRLDCTNSSGIN